MSCQVLLKLLMIITGVWCTIQHATNDSKHQCRGTECVDFGLSDCPKGYCMFDYPQNCCTVLPPTTNNRSANDVMDVDVKYGWILVIIVSIVILCVGTSYAIYRARKTTTSRKSRKRNQNPHLYNINVTSNEDDEYTGLQSNRRSLQFSDSHFGCRINVDGDDYLSPVVIHVDDNDCYLSPVVDDDDGNDSGYLSSIVRYNRNLSHSLPSLLLEDIPSDSAISNVHDYLSMHSPFTNQTTLKKDCCRLANNTSPNFELVLSTDNENSEHGHFIQGNTLVTSTKYPLKQTNSGLIEELFGPLDLMGHNLNTYNTFPARNEETQTNLSINCPEHNTCQNNQTHASVSSSQEHTCVSASTSPMHVGVRQTGESRDTNSPSRQHYPTHFTVKACQLLEQCDLYDSSSSDEGLQGRDSDTSETNPKHFVRRSDRCRQQRCSSNRSESVDESQKLVTTKTKKTKTSSNDHMVKPRCCTKDYDKPNECTRISDTKGKTDLKMYKNHNNGYDVPPARVSRATTEQNNKKQLICLQSVHHNVVYVDDSSPDRSPKDSRTIVRKERRVMTLMARDVDSNLKQLCEIQETLIF